MILMLLIGSMVNNLIENFMLVYFISKNGLNREVLSEYQGQQEWQQIIQMTVILNRNVFNFLATMSALIIYYKHGLEEEIIYLKSEKTLSNRNAEDSMSPLVLSNYEGMSDHLSLVFSTREKENSQPMHSETPSS